MAHIFGDYFDSDDFAAYFEEIAFRPHIRRGQETRTGLHAMTHLPRLMKMAGFATASGKVGARRAGRGRTIVRTMRRMQRVLVKARIVRHGGKGRGALRKHLFYLQREGAGIDGNVPEAFTDGRNLSNEEVQEFGKRCVDDRHHFRFIVSPENGQELNLKAFARALIRKAETQLGTDLDWVGVAHHNTDNPHVHIIVRGKDDRGKDLVMKRDFVAQGLRLEAQMLVTQELGPRTDRELWLGLEREVTQGRYTSLDLDLIEMVTAHPEECVDMREVLQRGGKNAQTLRNLQIGRLHFLETMGLAHEASDGVWKVDKSLAERLREIGLRNDIIKTMHRRMQGLNPEAQVAIFDPEGRPGTRISGRVIHVGLIDELQDARYVLLESQDRRVHYVSLASAQGEGKLKFQLGAKLQVTIHERRELTSMDHEIQSFAEANSGIFDPRRVQGDAEARVVKIPGRKYLVRAQTLCKLGAIKQLSDGMYEVPVDLSVRLSRMRTNYLEVSTIDRGQDLSREIQK